MQSKLRWFFLCRSTCYGNLWFLHCCIQLSNAQNCSLGMFWHKFVLLDIRWLAREDQHIWRDRRTRGISCLRLHCLDRTVDRQYHVEPEFCSSLLRGRLRNNRRNWYNRFNFKYSHLPKYPANPNAMRNMKKISRQITSVHERFVDGPLNLGSWLNCSPERSNEFSLFEYFSECLLIIDELDENLKFKDKHFWIYRQ